MPGMNSSQVYPMTERVRQAIEGYTFPRGKGIQGALIVSQGIASFPAHCQDRDSLVFCAGMALLTAKREGRNRTSIYVPITEEAISVVAGEQKETAGAVEKAEYTAYLSTIYALAAAIDAKDHFTYGHSQKVARYAVGLGKAVGLSDEELACLRTADCFMISVSWASLIKFLARSVA